MYGIRGADGYISPDALTRRLRFIPDRWEKGFSTQLQAWGMQTGNEAFNSIAMTILNQCAISIVVIDKRNCTINRNTVTSYFGAEVQLYGKANGIPKYHKAYRKQSLKLSLMHGETSSGFEN